MFRTGMARVATRGLAALLGAAIALAAPVPGLAAQEPIRVANLGGGFIEFLLGGARQAEPAPTERSAPPPAGAPRAAGPSAAGIADPAAPREPSAWSASYCVRSCDGYAFPLGAMRGRGDAPAHARGCAAACPGAATELYVGTRAGGFAQARAFATGAPYAAHPAAFRHRTERVEGCTCAIAENPAARWAGGDATLRRGDVLVTADGALVFDGRSFVDFAQTRAAPPALRGRIDARLGLTARAERLEAWRRAHPQAALRADTARQAATQAAAPLPPARPAALDGADLAFVEGGLRRP